MRFSTSFLATAGLSALAFAAPITSSIEGDACDYVSEPSSTVTAVAGKYSASYLHKFADMQ